MLKRTIFIIAILILGTSCVYAQLVDSCLTLYQNIYPNHDSLWKNPDSVMVDTCITGSAYSRMFIKTSFSFEFNYYVLSDSISSSTQDTDIRSWTDINPAYPEIRNGFSNIEQRFGPFILIGPVAYMYTDTASVDAKEWLMDFSNYVSVDSVLIYLNAIPELTGVSFIDGFYESGGAVVAPPEEKSLIKIWPQPCNSQLFIQGNGIFDNILFYDPLGRQIKLPITSTNELLMVDVSNQPSGIVYANISGQFFKILIQK
jgi:hypothetical protein